MTITRIQALIIAAGLALVGVAVARAGNESLSAPERVRILDGRSLAQSYPLRDNRLRDETPLGAPAASVPGKPFSRL
jgi:hypothetical protein